MSTDGQVSDQEKASFLKRPMGGGGKAAKADAAPKAGKLGIPARPQVNLMPPEVLTGRKLAVLKRRLVWLILLLVLACLVAFGLSYLVRMDAQSRHEDSLVVADQLLAEKKKYSPVTRVLRDIDNTKESRTFVLGTEVNWSDFIYAIEDVLPDGVTIESLSVQGIGPGVEPPKGPDDLTQPGIAVMTFSANSETLPDASEWIDALNSVPGLADTNLQSSTLEDETGSTTYLVSATVQVTEDALAHRTFSDEAVEDTETDEEDEG